MSYWVEFTDGSAACVELIGDERPTYPELGAEKPLEPWRAACAQLRGEALQKKVSVFGKTVARFNVLPYPASPRLGSTTDCPPYCWQPEKCKGRGSCPRPYACSE